jgi:hypothetical protein
LLIALFSILRALIVVAQSGHGAFLALRALRQANRCPEIKERPIELSNAPTRDEGVNGLPHLRVCVRSGASAFDFEHAREKTRDVWIEQAKPSTVGKDQHRTRRVTTDTGYL